MRAAVITFPGSNCDRDMRVALADITGQEPRAIWHQDTDLGDVDLIALPGGFSYGDYLRCGAMAARSAIMPEVVKAAARGVRILGVCNGFQVLTELGLLPGALMRNQNLHFICKTVEMDVVNRDSDFTRSFAAKTSLPVAHHDGNYFADSETLAELEDNGRIAFRYRDNVNGSQNNIAGILNDSGTVLGMMPHPERAIDAATGSTEGRPLFQSLVETLS